MSKVTSLEELVKKYLSKNPTLGTPDSYDLYKHKNNLSTGKSYSDAVNSLYASMRKSSSLYGANNRNAANKGLQNSGYSSYIDDLSVDSFTSDLNKLKSSYSNEEEKNRASYVSYLDKYNYKKEAVKKNVMSHLVSNDILDLNTAIAYGMTAGLSTDDAKAVGESAYAVTKQKIFNKIIEQTVTLGLDKEGAKNLALKMGVNEADASVIAEEISELLEHYNNISDEYLDYLEQRSK